MHFLDAMNGHHIEAAESEMRTKMTNLTLIESLLYLIQLLEIVEQIARTDVHSSVEKQKGQ